jgi:hypothetical protein
VHEDTTDGGCTAPSGSAVLGELGEHRDIGLVVHERREHVSELPTRTDDLRPG